MKNKFLIALLCSVVPVLAQANPVFVKTGSYKGKAAFILNDLPFYFSGVNSYWLMQKQAQHQGNAFVENLFEEVKALGFNVIRTWAFADGHQWTHPSDPAILQKSPGIYNEATFKALDYVIAKASEKNVKLILTLTNNWGDFGGIQEYVKWAGLSDSKEFFTNEKVKILFKNHLTKILSRKNSYTGILYRSDPAIFSWELCNEARIPGDTTTGATLRNWYQEMARHIKSIDSNHMISTGEEGFDISQDYYSNEYSNTYPFQGTEGSSYQLNTVIDEISYATAHFHPNSWGLNDQNDGNKWIKDHIELANEHGKPFVLGEYGDVQSFDVFDWLATLSQEGGAGSLLWGFLPLLVPKGITEDATTVRYPKNAAFIGALSAHAIQMNDLRN